MSIERIMGIEVTNDTQYEIYREKMEPLLIKFGGAFGYDFKIAQVLRSKSGKPINRVFTIDFPNQQAMDDFFNHPEYLAIKQSHFENSVGARSVISIHETQ